jgi:lysyl endopeptidase
MTKIQKYLIFCLFLITPALYSQLPHGGKPFPYNTLKSGVRPVILPAFNMQKAIEESLSEQAISGKKPFKFAWNYSLDLSPENAGTWTDMPGGTRVWRIHLVSTAAYGVNIDFSKYRLKPGCSVFIYPPDQDYFLGGFNYKNNNESGSLPVSFIKGEELVVELQTQPGISDYGALQIGSLAHAYIDIFSQDNKELSPDGVCSVDINCPEGADWQLIKKAVCMISIKSGSSTTTCTGTLINNTNLDTVPYLLTANHCISSQYQATSSVFKFNYEVDTCGKKFISRSYSLAGSTLLSTSDSLDFTLLRLSESPPEIYKPFFAGWSLSQNPATSSVCIHHPLSGIKKISKDNDPLTAEYQDPIPSNLAWLYNESLPQAHWRVISWEIGTTEGGSSGSPLFNQNKLVVGNLTGGESSCAGSVFVNDYFSKFFMGWDHYSLYSKQLKHWLDPGNKGIINLPGFNPYGQPDTSIIDTIEYASRFTVFPNPASGLVTFETDSLDITGGSLAIFTVTGRKMVQYTISEPARLTFDVSYLEQGIYILEFSKGNIRERKRLLVINHSR